MKPQKEKWVGRVESGGVYLHARTKRREYRADRYMELVQWGETTNYTPMPAQTNNFPIYTHLLDEQAGPADRDLDLD